MNRAGASLSERSDGKGGGRVFLQAEPRIHKMLAHPVRFRIVWRLGDGPATAAQLADLLEESPKYISRLLTELQAEDLVEVVREEANPKGGKIYTYRATDRYLWDAEEWAACQRSSGRMPASRSRRRSPKKSAEHSSRAHSTPISAEF